MCNKACESLGVIHTLLLNGLRLLPKLFRVATFQLWPPKPSPNPHHNSTTLHSLNLPKSTYRCPPRREHPSGEPKTEPRVTRLDVACHAHARSMHRVRNKGHSNTNETIRLTMRPHVGTCSWSPLTRMEHRLPEMLTMLPLSSCCSLPPNAG